MRGFVNRFKEKFGNDAKTLKNVIENYFQNDDIIAFEDENEEEILIGSVSFCGWYLKTEEDINCGFLEEGKGVSQRGIYFL